MVFFHEFDEEMQHFRPVALPQWEEITKGKPESSGQEQKESKPRDNKEEREPVCSFYVCPDEKKLYRL